MIAILGSGGHAKVVISTLRAMGHTELCAFDDNPERFGQEVLGVPIRGTLADAMGPAIIALGSNVLREKLDGALGLEWFNAVHPAAVVDASVKIGPGTVVFAGAIIQPDTTLGRHVVINTSASVDHDCRLADYAFVAPGAHLAGTVTLGKRAFVGTGASVIPNLTLGDDVIVGAGAVVLSDLFEAGTFVGVPARRK